MYEQIVGRLLSSVGADDHQIVLLDEIKYMMIDNKLVYHGTTRTALRGILSTGIVPRPSESRGSWPNAVSATGFVYLTEAHALHYAMSPERNYRGDYALLEISLADILEARLFPDEDYLEQETWPKGAHYNDPDWSLDMVLQQHLWRDSLDKLGNIAVAGVIPTTAITRYAILSQDRLFWEGFYHPESDRRITRYQERKAQLQASLSLFFDDVPKWKRLTRPDFDGMMAGRSVEDRAVLWAAAQAIQVVTLDKGKVSHRTARNLPLPTEIRFRDNLCVVDGGARL